MKVYQPAALYNFLKPGYIFLYLPHIKAMKGPV